MSISKKRVLKLIGEKTNLKEEKDNKQDKKQEDVIYEIDESLFASLEEEEKENELNKLYEEVKQELSDKKKVKTKLNEQEEEDVDVAGVIKELGKTDYKDDNKLQGKMVQLMKGLAFSDDEKATKFMNKVSDALTKIANDME